MHRQKGKRRFRLAVDDELWTHAISELAYISHEAGARVNRERRLQGSVNNTDICGMLRAWRRTGSGVEMRLTAKVQRDVLLRNEASANAGAQMLVQEARHLGWGDVSPTLEKTFS